MLNRYTLFTLLLIYHSLICSVVRCLSASFKTHNDNGISLQVSNNRPRFIRTQRKPVAINVRESYSYTKLDYIEWVDSCLLVGVMCQTAPCTKSTPCGLRAQACVWRMQVTMTACFVTLTQ